VLAVEHHIGFLEASDWIVELGPGGGDEGGRLIAEGPPLEIRRNTKSLTGRFLAGPRGAGEAGAPPYNVTEIP
jgi:excinuclease ABC subunit A